MKKTVDAIEDEIDAWWNVSDLPCATWQDAAISLITVADDIVRNIAAVNSGVEHQAATHAQHLVFRLRRALPMCHQRQLRRTNHGLRTLVPRSWALLCRSC